MIRVFFLLFSLCASINARASEQGLFYNLHQAVNLLEQSSTGKCKNKEIIKTFLIKADKELGELLLKDKAHKSNLDQHLQTSWKMFKSKKLETWQVEDLRLKLHESGEKMKLKHNTSWYLKVKGCGEKLSRH